MSDSLLLETQQNQGDGDSSSSSSWYIVFGFMMVGPTLAALYAISVLSFLASWGEISWYSKTSSLLLRLALWGASLAIAWSCCTSTSTSSISSTSFWITILPVSTMLFVVSGYLMYQTRVDVTGPVPSALLELQKSKSSTGNKCCSACQVNNDDKSTTTPLLLHDKVVIVTGANTGIGKETCFQLAQLGATVIMACRNADRARTAQEELQQRLKKERYCCSECQEKLEQKKNNNNNNNSSNIEDSFLILPLDLSNLASVRRAIHILVQDMTTKESSRPFRLSQIHALINNAGVMFSQQVMTEPDGYEMCFQANHLGHYLFTRLLIQAVEKEKENERDEKIITAGASTKEEEENEHKLRSTKKASFRILNLSSITYKMAKTPNLTTGRLEHRLDLHDLNCTIHRTYSLFGQYAQTKLCNLLFTQELVRRGYVSYAINPGLVRTDVTRNMAWWLYYGDRAVSLIMKSLQKTPSQGAYTSTWATTVGMVGTMNQEENRTTTTSTTNSTDLSLLPPNGSFLSDSAVMETNTYVTHHAVEDAKQLWTLSEEMVKWDEYTYITEGRRK